jgi:site-specific DNA-methyltransferase (adenine-specific)
VSRDRRARPQYRSRVATRTQPFGTGKRESHDARDFYARFATPEISNDDAVQPCSVRDQLFCGDARAMTAVDDGCVALVVTSPPYYAGKEYERALGEGHVPASYVEFLAMLRDVFAECRRVLEPGGRLAVNVANLGRRPYRSLSADVIRILEEDLGLLLRGEIVWRKAKGATGSIAVGSYRSASNPVLRDVTERVVVASKGRFDRAVPKKERQRRGLPHEDTVTKEAFFESTLDVWEIRPEHARRVGHPAPFPVELPERLIHLYTYRGDVVLDPFLGSGSTAVAAVRARRHYVGYDTDPQYVALAEARVAASRDQAPPGADGPEP